MTTLEEKKKREQDEILHDRQVEVIACKRSHSYFINNYVKIFDPKSREWIPFDLWPLQETTLETIESNHLVIILKARQIGMTWLCLAYALSLMLFHPEATILIFSKRDDEAVSLLTDRLVGMFERLPDWMRPPASDVIEVEKNQHEWGLNNGSVARAFPSTGADSYTATLAIIDEADLVPDLDAIMAATKPTIDMGGDMIVLSRAKKKTPNSPFKNMYRAAKKGLSGWIPVFLPWMAHPDRDEEWYDEVAREALTRTTSKDETKEQYPATDAEALAPSTLDKRIPAEFLLQCYDEREGIKIEGAPVLPGIIFYKAPSPTKRYVIGADPAEGNPTSNASSLHVLDKLTGEEVCRLSGRIEPGTFAGYIDTIGKFYNNAVVLVERNNHGHAVLLWLRLNSKLTIVKGHDGKEGWSSSELGKTLMYDKCTDAFFNEEVILHSFTTFTQLASIVGNTLLAPDGEYDDEADSFAFAHLARFHKDKKQREARSYQG